MSTLAREARFADTPSRRDRARRAPSPRARPPRCDRAVGESRVSPRAPTCRTCARERRFVVRWRVARFAAIRKRLRFSIVRRRIDWPILSRGVSKTRGRRRVPSGTTPRARIARCESRRTSVRDWILSPRSAIVATSRVERVYSSPPRRFRTLRASRAFEAHKRRRANGILRTRDEGPERVESSRDRSRPPSPRDFVRRDFSTP